MTYTRFKKVGFGTGKAGLATVGYRLYNTNNTANGARVTVGVLERGAGSGEYGALVTFPDDFVGELRWDTGEATPVYAGEDVNPEEQVVYLGVLAIGAGSVTVVSPVTASGKITIYSGYAHTGALRITLTEAAGSTWPADLTGATVHLLARTGQQAAAVTADITGEVVVATGSSKVVRFAPTALQTAPLTAGAGRYDAYATIATVDYPLVVGGQLVVKDRVPV